jgi:hypothetical protein
LDITSGTGIIPNPRGTLWSTMGRVVDAKMTVSLEEIMYLKDLLGYIIVLDGQIISFSEFLSCFPGFSVRDYEVIIFNKNVQSSFSLDL